ncbi:MAG: zinc-binding dehydrogenase [Deltaproteobacteria bacterium]|jgi:NADPH:quinone reductase-like Zn-dependent oxidoreductase|nr:zinc-binding dehydrogenase [Deltaproteobacteria bacterium]MBW2537311.1 zinc-binding dehydrogenase [Deltaproteobacteria bacterium]
MHKIVVPRAGSYDRLRLEEHPMPQPGPGEALVEVEASGVNYADVVVRMGLYASARTYVGWPITPGFEVAGRIRDVGSGVDDLKPGEPIIGVTRFGGYASHLVIPRAQIFRRPKGWSAEQAAGFPSVFLTAYYALHELAHPRSGARILVHSAAGGVGGALLQLGRIAECWQIGVVGSSHKRSTATELGADVVIDKSVERLWRSVEQHAAEGLDVIFDANGVATLRQSYRHLAPTGRLVVYGFHSMLPRKGGRPRWLKLAWDWLRTPRFNPLDLTNDNRSVLAFNLSYLFDRLDLLDEGMSELLRWAEAGQVRPLPTKSYPLADVARAHRDIESGRTVGKLVLVP